MAGSQTTHIRADRAAQNDLLTLLDEARVILTTIDLAVDMHCRARKLKPEARRISEHLVEALVDLDDRARFDLDTEDRHAA
jgi:hypothetical protein